MAHTTTRREVSIPDTLWRDAKVRAAQAEISMGDLVSSALRRYLRDPIAAVKEDLDATGENAID